MYAVSDTVAASVFSEIPPLPNYETTPSQFVNVQRHGIPTPSLIEGPSFDPDGNLWVVDICWGRIFRISPQGEPELIVRYDGEPNGLCFHRDGRLFIADHRNGIMVLDVETRKVLPYFTRANLEGFKGVNDLTFASNGDLYFTDQGQTGLQDATGRLFRLKPDMRLECLLDNVPSPNGLVLNHEENTMFLAVTRDNAVWRVPLLPDGGTTKVGRFIQLSGGSGPDGLALDAEGGLAVAHVGAGQVWLFDVLGIPHLRITSPRGILTTNIAFGGPDGRQLFITESQTGTVLVADVPVAGAPTYIQGRDG